ncbi:MAG: lysoplasmalogenase [Fulvivirga sp.]|nr:lysoplasmalogenase [Fulvivirga sp.]
MKASKMIMIAYLAALFTDIVAVYSDNQDLRVISKPVIMPLLVAYATTRFNEKSVLFKLLVMALLLSWAGDIFLLFDGNTAFLSGLIAFLLAHVGYILCFKKARNESELGLLRTQEMRYLFILLMAGIAVVVILLPHLGNLKMPVIIYAAVLTYMSITALYRYGKTSNTSFIFGFLGALLFMASDTMLSVNKFMGEFTGAGSLIMLTYGFAQLFIAESLIRHQQ